MIWHESNGPSSRPSPSTGRAVLNAADPLVVAMAGHCPGKVIYFARDADNPVLAAHHRQGGECVFVRNGAVTLARDDREQVLVELDRVPLTHGGLRRLPDRKHSGGRGGCLGA